MVQEVRKIIMSLDELLNAYVCYQRMTPDFMPMTRITGCKTGKDGVILTGEPMRGDSQPQEYNFQGTDALKPVIRFCIENNIMLPRHGKKSILYGQEHIILQIELNLSQDIPTSLGPMQINHINKMTFGADSNYVAVAAPRP